MARGWIVVGLGALLVLLAGVGRGGAAPQRPVLVVQGGHRAMAHAVAVSPDGRTLASAGGDDTAVLWDVSSGNLLAVLEHGAAVLAVAFSPDGGTLATGGADHAVRLWSVETGRLLSTLEGHDRAVRSLSFRPDGKWLASADEGRTAHVWELPGGRRVATREGASQVAFSPDGATLAAGDAEISLWREGRSRILARVEHSLQDLAWSPDGRTLAAATWDGTVRLWDAETGAPAGVLEGHLHRGEAPGRVGAVAFSPDGATLAAGAEDGAIHLWDPATGRRRGILRGHDMDVLGLAFASHGHSLFSAGFGPPLLHWDLETGKEERAFRSPVQEPRAIAFTPGSLLVATGDGLRTWSLETGVSAAVPQPDRLWALAASADGALRLTGDTTGAVRLGERELESRAEKPVVAAALSPDERLAATASWDGTARLWELPSGRLRHVLRTPPDDMGSQVPLNAVAFSPDGRTLATGGDDGFVRFWDTATGAEGPPWSIGPYAIYAQGVNRSDGVKALSWTDAGLIAGMGSGALLSESGGRLPEPHATEVTSLAVHGDLLATTSRDRTATIRELPSGRVLHRLRGHTGGVGPAAFHPLGHVLVTGGEDGTLRLWQVATGRQLAIVMSMDGDDWLATSPEGFVDGSLPGMQKVLWRLSDRLRDTASPEQFLVEFYHPGLLADVMGRALPVPELLRQRGDPRHAMDIAEKDRRTPEVQVRAPGTSASRTADVTVEVSAAPAGVRDVRLFRDGTLAARWPGLRTERLLKATVPVKAGPNVFRAYAFNGDNVKSPDSDPVEVDAADLGRRGRTLAVLIGIDRYADPDLDLSFAGADARLLAGALAQHGPGAVETRVLVDGEATRAGILAALDWLVREAGPEDLALVSYAGHGVRWRGRFYLLPQDFQPALASRDEAHFEAAALGDRDLEEALLPLQAGSSVLVLDACHSGAALEGDEWRLGPVNARGLGQLAWEKGMDVLAASQSQEAAMEAREIGGRPLGHGLLTWALARDAFARPAAPRNVAAWLDFAARRVPSLLVESGSPGAQRPRVFHGAKGPPRELRP